MKARRYQSDKAPEVGLTVGNWRRSVMLGFSLEVRGVALTPREARELAGLLLQQAREVEHLGETATYAQRLEERALQHLIVRE